MNKNIEKYVRGSDTLNPLRLMQAIVMYNNEITIGQYAELVYLNYGYGYMERSEMDEKILSVWEVSIKRFEAMGILVEGSDTKIKIDIFKCDINEK
jgi:hypothetical protein